MAKRIRRNQCDSVDEVCKLFNSLADEINLLTKVVKKLIKDQPVKPTKGKK